MLYDMMYCVLLCLRAWLCLVVRCVRDALCDVVWLVCVDVFLCLCVSFDNTVLNTCLCVA